MAVSFQTGAEPIPGYKFLDRLGSGGFGEVWRCEAPGGIFKAAKVIFGDLRDRAHDSYRFVEQELKSLKRVQSVRHPYLLALDRYDIVEGRLVIVMELADCNLWERFREHRAAGRPGIPRDELLRYMAETAEVLDLMNDKHQLQHLDIKPQNLFLLYNHVKVADFGQVKDLEGLVASVTGGITPVYAAPETFDGFVSRYCDQYSLACVYQELLTGHRPFDGTSMQQLLMQHLQAAPNLLPSPADDRPALLKALAKKPDDRFPSVGSFVRALREGGSSRISTPLSISVAEANSHTQWPQNRPGSELEATPAPRGIVETSAPPERPAPSEQTGPGPVRPALVIGLGFTGLQLLQRTRQALEAQFGSMENLPAIRMIGIDTDPEAIALAAAPREGGTTAALPLQDLIAARLNRSAHYLKPRNNGRLLTDGWFDSQIFYKMARQPATMGIRSLGRLAFCDHYRTILNKIQNDLDAVLDPAAIGETMARTGMDKRTNRPRVYILAGLGGGTGGGMFLDLAYAVRARLKRIGYAAPDITGILLTPMESPGQTIPAPVLANTFAALTELNHFADPETIFEAAYDDRYANIRDSDAPFTRTFILPGLDSMVPNGSGVVRTQFPARGSSGDLRRSGLIRKTDLTATPVPPRNGIVGERVRSVADFLRLDLLSPMGRAVDQARSAPAHASAGDVHTFGLKRFGWPRRDVVARTARIMAPVLFGNWVQPDAKHLFNLIPRWAEQQWQTLGLGNEQLGFALRRAADEAAGFPIESMVASLCEPLSAKGWLAKAPEPERVGAVLEQFVRVLGVPREFQNRVNTPAEDAIRDAGDAILVRVEAELCGMLPALMDTADFRFAGTEAAVRHLLHGLVTARPKLQKELERHEAAAGEAYERLIAFVHAQRGIKKATAQELAVAIRRFPTEWRNALVGRRVLDIYRRLQTLLHERAGDVAGCRAKAQGYLQHLVAEAETLAPPPQPDELLPVGCAAVEEAAQKFLAVLGDDDLGELEQRVQHAILGEFGGLYEACVNSGADERLLRILRRTTEAFLDERLGEIDFPAMLRQKFPGKPAFQQAVSQTYFDAEPKLVSGGLWARSELATGCAPAASGIEAILKPLMPAGSKVHAATDEVVLYREYSFVPLAALPQLGPVWSAAYHGAADMTQTSPHIRLDITAWHHVDA